MLKCTYTVHTALSVTELFTLGYSGAARKHKLGKFGSLMSVRSFLTHQKRLQTHNFQIFTPSSLPNSYCTTDRKIVPRENKADKKMRGENIHRKTLQLKTNRSLDKPPQHLQRQERTRLASTRLASTNPQQMKTILSEKRS